MSHIRSRSEFCKDHRMFPKELLYCEGRKRPVFRGATHGLGVLWFIPWSAALLGSQIDKPIELLALFILLCGNLFCWGSSALFHCGCWDADMEIFTQRLDHSAIFINIAASYTPFALLIASNIPSTSILSIFLGDADFTHTLNTLIVPITIITIWIGASLGVYHVFHCYGERFLYWLLLIGCSFPSYFLLSAYCTLQERVFALLGLLLYMIGTYIFKKRICNIAKKWFGYHEVFHVFTILAAFSSYALCYSLCLPTVRERCASRMGALYIPGYDYLVSFLTTIFTSEEDICRSLSSLSTAAAEAAATTAAMI